MIAINSNKSRHGTASTCLRWSALTASKKTLSSHQVLRKCELHNLARRKLLWVGKKVEKAFMTSEQLLIRCCIDIHCMFMVPQRMCIRIYQLANNLLYPACLICVCFTGQFWDLKGPRSTRLSLRRQTQALTSDRKTSAV